MDTLDRLQDMLCQFEGTLLLVSHDRSFLDNVVTSTIVMEGNGIVQEYAGGYQDYLRQSKQNTATAKSPKKEQAPSKEKKPVVEEKPRPTKLTFKHQHALKELPKKIEALDKVIANLELQLGDAGLYQRDSLKAQDLALQLESAKNKKAEHETEWLEIELLRESLL
jgi:ATP-binding cassette subfamily F protein uup